MFHSIEITPVDQMTHRFLWRNLNTTKEPDNYVITAVNFGDRPSAAIAIIALRKTAELSVENIHRLIRQLYSTATWMTYRKVCQIKKVL